MSNNAGRWRTDPYSIEFHDLLPEKEDIQQGVIYVSMRGRAIELRCPCGCGGLTELAIRPSHWSVTFDGKRLTLSPSIKASMFPCHSHYHIVDSIAVPA